MARINKMSEDEILKLKAVVLYIIKRCGAIDYFHLFKILYFADREHYAVYGRRLVSDTFCALKNGPVPSFLYDAVKALGGDVPDEELRIVTSALILADSDYKYIVSATEEPDFEELSASDIEMLDKSISENQALSFDTLSRKSHDIAWQSAWEKSQNSPMEPMLMARAAGASDATIEYIRESESFDALFGM